MTSVGLLTLLDDVGDRERLARAGDAEQHLMLRAGQHALGQLRNRLRLISGGLVGGDEFEHQQPSYERAAAASTQRAVVGRAFQPHRPVLAGRHGHFAACHEAAHSDQRVSP